MAEAQERGFLAIMDRDYSGHQTNPDLAQSLVERVLTAALPAIEHSCRKRFEEELLSEKAQKAAAEWLFAGPLSAEKSRLCKAFHAALKATREGAGDDKAA